MRVFGDERLTFQREAGVGLNTGAYFVAKQLAHLPTVLLAPALFLFAFAGEPTLTIFFCEFLKKVVVVS
jgi:hypothetical protein